MKIAFLGDMAFYGRYSLGGNGDAYRYFAETAEFLKQYDLVVGNLETPFVSGGRPFGAKSAYIKADPENASLLAYLNVGIVNLANNHIFDYGKGGYRLTKKILDDMGIGYFGIEDRQLFLEKGDNRLAFHGYCCYSTNPLGVNRGGRHGVDQLSIPAVEERLRENAARGYYNVVSVHCGQEHVNYPSHDTILMARRFAEVSPYLFYGHHPHVMQGVEKAGESLICYSLGNFCFDDVYTAASDKPLIVQSENNKSSFILELELEESRLKSHRMIPLYAGEKSLTVERPELLEQLEKYSAALCALEPVSYTQARNAMLQSYYASRKQLRDLAWFLKRLTPRYAKLLASSYVNRYKYGKCISAYLDKGN